MNKKTLYWTVGIITVVIVFLIFWGVSGNNGSSQDHAGHTKNTNLAVYMESQEDIMESMMEDMEDITPVGYAALDFLNGMIPHHEAAVSMSESYLKYGGDNAELKQLAEDIIKVQEQEIDEMRTMIDEIASAGNQDKKQEDAYLKEYAKMFSAHESDHSSHTSPDNVEAAFAEGMIMHHQMAVEMAQAILNHTDEESVIKLANTIIETQNQEIEKMQKLLDSAL